MKGLKFIVPAAALAGCSAPQGQQDAAQSALAENPADVEIVGDTVPCRYLFPDDYMADPAAHVFDGKLYIYPSHDWESGVPENDNGDHFNMKDYHVFEIDGDPMTAPVRDCGKVLDVADIKWAGRQLWDNDVAKGPDGKYYMYFPMKDKEDIFRMGVAISETPAGPFVPEPEPIAGSYSMDYCAFQDGDTYYMYFGGIWGGQLQRYRDNVRLEKDSLPEGKQVALAPKVTTLGADMKSFAEEPADVLIVDSLGNQLTADNPFRFFEASWVHKYNGTYYLSYSTGDSHFICYATSDNPRGPFTYRGVVLTPVVGWTTHHSICEYNGKWYLFYHDSVPSGGKTYLRSMKVCEITYDENGAIRTICGMSPAK